MDWVRNDLSQVTESPEAVFRTRSRNDVTLVWAIGGTLLGTVAALAFTGATVFILLRGPALFLAVLTGVPALGAIALLSVFARELFARVRRMGDFVLDARERALSRPDGLALGRVTAIRPTTRFAVGVPQTGVSWWIAAAVDGGAVFRIARGSWSDVRALLLRLRELGLPVEGVDDSVLLKSFASSVTRLGAHRFEFRCPETMAKIVAPFILVVWVGFASIFLIGPISTHAPSETWLCMSPLFVFFAAGITIGILNTLHFYRRSGTFVVDTTEGRLYRNGALVAHVSRFVTGNPSQRGVTSARKGLGRAFGPQVLAVQLRNGRTFNLLRGMPGDVRFAADLLRAESVPITDL